MLLFIGDIDTKKASFFIVTFFILSQSLYGFRKDYLCLKKPTKQKTLTLAISHYLLLLAICWQIKLQSVALRQINFCNSQIHYRTEPKQHNFLLPSSSWKEHPPPPFPYPQCCSF